MGWRLGGKGASGRGVADRIEEHGLHLWMGFYENAFRLMRDCYEERRADTAGLPLRRLAGRLQAGAGRRRRRSQPGTAGSSGWRIFPAGTASPAIRSPAGPRSTVLSYLRQSVMLVGELLRSAGAMRSDGSLAGGHGIAGAGPGTGDGDHRGGCAAALRPARDHRRAAGGERHPAAGDRPRSFRSSSRRRGRTAAPDRRARRGGAETAGAARGRATASCGASGM